MQRPKLSWVILAAGVGVLCFFWFLPSGIEKSANDKSPLVESPGAGKVTDIAGASETTSEDISRISTDSPDSPSFEGGNSGNNSERLPDHKKKIEDLKCTSPELPALPDIPPELDPRVNHFDYIESPDSEMAERALAGDGEAQQFYAMRLQGRLMDKFFQQGFANDTERYRWAQEFKVMRNFFILAIKNRSRVGARLLGDTLFMNPLQKDRIDSGAWLYIDLMLAGDSGKKRTVALFDKAKLTEQEKQDSLLRAKAYIDLFSLWFLRPSADSSKEALKAKFELPAGEEHAKALIERIPGECLHEYVQTLEEKDNKTTPLAGATSDLVVGGEMSVDNQPDPYAMALGQLQVYQAESTQYELMGYMEKEKVSALSRRFGEIRILLISALQSGNRKALPVLIKMYLHYPREYDPLEAAAWMEIGKALYNYSGNHDGVTDRLGIPDAEFKRRTAVLTRQYIAIYGLN